MRRFYTVSATLLAVVMLAACGGERKNKERPLLPEFEELTFAEQREGCYDVKISYQHIKNCEASPAFELIERRNIELTLPYVEALEGVDVSFEERVEGYMEEFRKMFDSEYMTSCSLNLRHAAFFARNNTVLCYERDLYTYLGGAHGMNMLHYTCYDVATGQHYDFSYLNGGEWAEALSALICNRLLENYAPNELFLGESQRLHVPDSVLITDEGLLLVYQPYEIAPYSTGIVTVELSDADIAATGAPLLWVESPSEHEADADAQADVDAE